MEPALSIYFQIEQILKKRIISGEYKPGEKAIIELKLTDDTGEPFVGSTVVTVYDQGQDGHFP